MRVVMDTAVLVAALRSPDGASRLWLESFFRREHTLLISVPLALEYEAVLLRPEHRAATGLGASDVQDLVTALCALCEPVHLTYIWRPMVIDPGDEMVAETAFVGRADRLLTFNLRDFAGVDRFGVAVERPGPAWHALKGN